MKIVTSPLDARCVRAVAISFLVRFRPQGGRTVDRDFIVLTLVGVIVAFLALVLVFVL